MLEAERRFRRIVGHADLAKLAIAVERELAAERAADHRYTPVAPRGAGGRRFTRLRHFTHRIAAVEFHGERDILGRAIDDG
jgi:hypothetical protein